MPLSVISGGGDRPVRGREIAALQASHPSVHAELARCGSIIMDRVMAKERLQGKDPDAVKAACRAAQAQTIDLVEFIIRAAITVAQEEEARISAVKVMQYLRAQAEAGNPYTVTLFFEAVKNLPVLPEKIMQIALKAGGAESLRFAINANNHGMMSALNFMEAKRDRKAEAAQNVRVSVLTIAACTGSVETAVEAVRTSYEIRGEAGRNSAHNTPYCMEQYAAVLADVSLNGDVNAVNGIMHLALDTPLKSRPKERIDVLSTFRMAVWRFEEDQGLNELILNMTAAISSRFSNLASIDQDRVRDHRKYSGYLLSCVVDALSVAETLNEMLATGSSMASVNAYAEKIIKNQPSPFVDSG